MPDPQSRMLHELAKGVIERLTYADSRDDDAQVVSELLAELATARRALSDAKGRWNFDMDAAPKDGTRILLAWNGETRLAWWRTWPASLNGAFKAGACWKVPSLETVPVGCKPVAWQPLPTPPSEEINTCR